MGSVALVPLGEKGSLGLLALGSADRDRFHPGMSTEFLARLADLIADALSADATPEGRGCSGMTPAALEWVARFRRYLSSRAAAVRRTPTRATPATLRALVKFCDRLRLARLGRARYPARAHLRRARARRGLAPRSIQRRLSAVRSFYEFLLREGAAPRLPPLRAQRRA